MQNNALHQCCNSFIFQLSYVDICCHIFFPTTANITNSTQSYKFACCFMCMCNWKVILQEEHRLGVFEKWLLTKALVYNKKEVTSNRRLEKKCILHVLYSSPSIIRVRKSNRTRYVCYWHALARTEIDTLF